MDKNMIHIDDLIKQRLGNGEEKERPGAWLQMRDLLDKEMPEKAPVVFNWRRMMGLVAAVGLLASVSVGGYYAVNSMRTDDINDTTPVASVSSPGTNASANNNDHNDNNSNIVAPGVDEHENQNSNTQKTTTNTTDKGNQNAPKSLKDNTKTKHNASNQSNNNTAQQAQATATTGNQNVTSGQVANNSKTPATEKANKPAVAVTQTVTAEGSKKQQNVTAANNTSANNKATTAAPADKSSSAVPATTNKEPLVAANTANTNKPSNNAGQQLVPNSSQGNNNNSSRTNAINPPVPQADNTRNLKIEKDSMNKMNVVQRWNRKAGFSSDTIGMGKMPVDKLVGNEPKPSTATTQSVKNNAVARNEEVVPAASLALAAKTESKEGELVPLETYRVSRKKTSRTWDPERFDEMVRDAKFKLSRIHFYPGLLVGGNSSFGDNNLSGFHAGISGVISFNEKWSVLTELKYMHRFHGGNIQDDYLRSTDSSKVINGVKYYSYDSVEHYFNFPTVSSIELPIALRYAIKRFQIFAGANMVYHFTVNNIYEGDRLHPKETAATGTVNYTWQNGLPSITISDFSSRFGVGALLGAAYQMTPAMQLDIRMTKTMWDNAATPGAKQISNILYKTPSMQMTLTYRLSSSRPPKPAR